VNKEFICFSSISNEVMLTLWLACLAALMGNILSRWEIGALLGFGI
jgi:hypothetical protein